MTPGRTGPALVLLVTLFSAACSGPGGDPSIPLPAHSPEDAALALFRFASTMNEESALPPGLVRDDLAEEQGGALMDQLEELVGATPPRVISVERFPDTDRAAVDLRFDLPGEGFATWSVQVEHGPDDGWRVVWVQGPGAGWPPGEKSRDEGLSISPVPGAQL